MTKRETAAPGARGEKRGRGRPIKTPEPGSRANITIRTTADLKIRIDNAAKRNGRTQAAEAESRLLESFAGEPFGREPALRTLMLHAMLAFARRGEATAKDAGIADNWMNDPACYLAGFRGAVDSLLVAYPGEITPENARLLIESTIGPALSNRINRRDE